MTTIPITDIKIFQNTRTELNEQDLSETMSDIRENGLIHPLTIMRKDGQFILACGHRRFAALKKLGRKELVVGEDVKISSLPFSPTNFLILNLSENLHRVDNTPIELAKGCGQLREQGLSINEIAVRLSIPKTRIETSLRLLSKVPEKHKSEIGYTLGKKNIGKIPATVASKITSLRVKQADINELFDMAKKEALTVRDIDLYSKLLEQGNSLESAIKAKDKYVPIQVNLVVNKEEFDKYKEPFQKVLIRILKGQEKPNTKLLY